MDLRKKLLPHPRFDAETEKEFYRDFNRKTIRFFRLGGLMGIFLYLYYFLTDIYLNPDVLFAASLVRFVYVPLGVGAILLLSYKKGFAAWQQAALASIFFISGSGVLVVFFLSESDLVHLQLLGFLLLMVYFSLVMRFTFFWSIGTASVCSIVTILVFVLSGIQAEVAFMFSSLTLTTLGTVILGSYFIEESFRVEFALTRQLTAARERAENATRLKDKFVSLVSHDLRGPIGTVKSFVDLAIEEKRDDGSFEPEAGEYLDRSSGILHGLMDMINRLLDISRLQTGRIMPEKGYFDLKLLVADRVEKISGLARRKNIEVKNELPDGMKLYIDCDLIGEVVLNLLTNAAKFTPTGGVILISSPAPGQLSIRNTGICIPPNLLPDLFKHEVKTSTPGTDGEQGTGLGLPYCKDIMEAHQGSIAVESGDEGTTFTLTFPDEKPTVLVADDQEVHRIAIREELLKLSDIEVLEAGDGEAALRIARERIPALIITDLHMPTMDGFAFIESLRNDGGLSNIPIIVNSAMSSSSGSSGDPEDPTSTIDARSRALELGANDFITKPLVPKDFVPRVKRYLP